MGDAFVEMGETIVALVTEQTNAEYQFSDECVEYQKLTRLMHEQWIELQSTKLTPEPCQLFPVDMGS